MPALCLTDVGRQSNFLRHLTPGHMGLKYDRYSHSEAATRDDANPDVMSMAQGEENTFSVLRFSRTPRVRFQFAQRNEVKARPRSSRYSNAFIQLPHGGD